MKHDKLLTDDADLVERLESATENFMAPLHVKEPLSEDAYEDLLLILDECQTAWEIEPYVPMAAAAIFLDLMRWPYNLGSWYQQPQKKEILDAASIIEQRIVDIVNSK